jgi:hypothetical protein
MRHLPLVLALAACGRVHNLADAGADTEMTGDASTGGQTLVKELPLQLDRSVDLLFVIDNSASMREEQANLAANFPKFIDVLQHVQGGLPDLHIGVVSSNLGAGNYNFAQCPVGGDQGHLLQGPGTTSTGNKSGACAGLAPGATYISDVANGGGGRTQNYTGQLAEVFSCMAQLGTDGCGLEHHLESMRAALDPSNTFNAGFLRQDAVLGVIFVGDEDDCSASDPSVYDPADMTKGPINFRCTEYGVTCDGDADPLHLKTFGARTSCKPREDSAYLYPVQRYIDFLKALKPDPRMLVVADIGGPATPFTIGPDTYENMPTQPALQASCMSSNGYAVPAVRRAALAAAFPGRSSVSTICSTDFSDAESTFAQQLTAAIGDPCIDATLADADAATPGVQPDCSVVQVTNLGTAKERTVPVPQCTPAGPGAHANAPCWYLDADVNLCAATASHLKLVPDYGGASAPLDTVLRLSCKVQ